MPKKISKSLPVLADITFERVRDAAVLTAYYKPVWFNAHDIIDILNGYNPTLQDEAAAERSLAKAHAKLGPAKLTPWSVNQQIPTPTQLKYVRQIMDQLVDAKLVDQQQGGHAARSNSGYVYRWITDEVRESKARHQRLQARSKNLQTALAVSLKIKPGALGVERHFPHDHDDDEQVTRFSVWLNETEAEALCARLNDTPATVARNDASDASRNRDVETKARNAMDFGPTWTAQEDWGDGHAVDEKAWIVRGRHLDDQVALIGDFSEIDKSRTRRLAEYIAVVDPGTIIEMIETINQLRAERDTTSGDGVGALGVAARARREQADAEAAFDRLLEKQKTERQK